MAGRPSKFSNELSAKMIVLYEEGKTDLEVSKIIGVSVRSIHYWKEKQPEFLHSIREAKEVADSAVEYSLYKRAVGYNYPLEKIFYDNGKIIRVETTKHLVPSVKAQIFWLRNRQPDRWGR